MPCREICVITIRDKRTGCRGPGRSKLIRLAALVGGYTSMDYLVPLLFQDESSIDFEFSGRDWTLLVRVRRDLR